MLGTDCGRMLGCLLKSARFPPILLQIAEIRFSENQTERITKLPSDLNRCMAHLERLVRVAKGPESAG